MPPSTVVFFIFDKKYEIFQLFFFSIHVVYDHVAYTTLIELQLTESLLW